MNGNETSVPSESDQSNPESSTEIQRVGIAEAKTAYDNGKAVFIDVRGDQYFAEKHIPGALSIPESEITNQMSQLNQSDWIITYCT
jgi:rhodanese-related sulfurtransferase